LHALFSQSLSRAILRLVLVLRIASSLNGPNGELALVLAAVELRIVSELSSHLHLEVELLVPLSLRVRPATLKLVSLWTVLFPNGPFSPLVTLLATVEVSLALAASQLPIPTVVTSVLRSWSPSLAILNSVLLETIHHLPHHHKDLNQRLSLILSRLEPLVASLTTFLPPISPHITSLTAQ